MKTVNVILNGKPATAEVEDKETLLHTLRERFGIRSVREGCGIGECGTCTVLIDDEPHYSCLTLASKVDGRDVKTVEFLGEAGALHPLQEAFIKYGAVQCGYCTPGMLLSAYSLLLKNRAPDRETIKEAISGNLCRCTGYIQIEEAIAAAAQRAGQRSELENNSSHAVTRLSTQGGHAPVYARWSRALTILQSKEHVLVRLAGHGDVRVIAGGTDLLIGLRKGKAEGSLVDITGVQELQGIARENGEIRIGAATTHEIISTDTIVGSHARSLAMACGWVGSPQIRNMGTVGGNLVNASPAADSIPPLLIHDAVVTLESHNPPSCPPLLKGGAVGFDCKGGQEGGSINRRRMKLEDFIVAPYKTVIKEDELLTSITLKGLPGYREGYRRVTKRATWAISRLALAWAIQEEEGVFGDVRLAIGSCTPMPFRPVKVEVFLRGKKKEKGIIVEAVESILRDIRDITGIRPSFAYKIPVLKGILESALRGQ